MWYEESSMMYLQNIMKEVSQSIEFAGINAQIEGRVKDLLSIYRKMNCKNKLMSEIYDLFAVRIIVDTIPDCYSALHVVQRRYQIMPGRFKDYIVMPKPNMYQSLHTTLLLDDGRPFEIQIRTYSMHETAEYGSAAHWKYKQLTVYGK